MDLKETAEALAQVARVAPKVLGAGQISLEDLSLEELLDVRRGNQEYVAWLKSERTTTDEALGNIDTMITLRMEQTGARKFEHAGFHGSYVKQKSGAASMLSPEVARKRLLALPEVPKRVIEAAFEESMVVKGKLREFRKISDYSAEAAAIVKAFISEPLEREVLVIEEVRPILNITFSASRLESPEAES